MTNFIGRCVSSGTPILRRRPINLAITAFSGSFFSMSEIPFRARRISTCFVCLFGWPECCLPCGHFWCENCFCDFGKRDEAYLDTIPLKSCLLCRTAEPGEPWPVRICVRPRLSGTRVLTLLYSSKYIGCAIGARPTSILERNRSIIRIIHLVCQHPRFPDLDLCLYRGASACLASASEIMKINRDKEDSPPNSLLSKQNSPLSLPEDQLQPLEIKICLLHLHHPLSPEPLPRWHPKPLKLLETRPPRSSYEMQI